MTLCVRTPDRHKSATSHSCVAFKFSKAGWQLENKAGSRTKNGPSVKSSGRGTGSHVVSGRGRAVIYTRGWGPVSSTHIIARCAISDERAYAQMPGNKAEWQVCHETIFGLFAHTLFQPILVQMVNFWCQIWLIWSCYRLLNLNLLDQIWSI